MYLHKCIFVQFVCHTIHSAFCHICIVWCIRWERWERYNHIASFFLPLLLVIVLYDGVGTYNEITIVDWYVDVDDEEEEEDVELCQSIC